MSLTAEDARYYLESAKTLTGPFRWNAVRKEEPQKRTEIQKERPATAGRLDLLSQLAIGKAQPRNIRLRVSVFPRKPNVATFQLECAMVPPRGNRIHVLYRLEWHPFSGHSNRFDLADGNLAGRYFENGETHEHICLDHVDDNGVVRAGDVHAARPLAVDPRDFNEALAYVCARLSITNCSEILPPEAQGELL
ncbi:hypothetical protein [Fulvimarina endophytica]|uniref:hypothetical protein n=1 Tax=Fulvimarina endophytica TaxID=2293836 RepID=UPI0011C04F5F|nr:hypothetical protein [Fulvimarina endophytica]